MSARSRWLMLAVGLGVSLNPLNSSMIAVAIARLQHVFKLEYTVVSWLIFSFYIASAVTQPVMGKMSDLFGRRKIFLAGLVISFISSVLAPFSPHFGWLVVSRVVQSIGTSMMIAVGMAIVRVHITEKQATALSVLSIFLSGAAAIGPFAGGILLRWWDWPAIFVVNLPFTAASFLIAWRMIPKDEAAAPQAGRASIRSWLTKIDALGILFFTVSLIALLVGLLSVSSSGNITLWSGIAMGIGLVALGTFIRHEVNTASPFIPLRTFKQYPAMFSVNVQFMLVNFLFYTLFFGLPSYLQIVRHVSEFQTGILMLTLGVSSLIASPIAGKWVDRAGPRPAMAVSAILMMLGSAWLAALKETSPVIHVCFALTAFGIANGLNAVGMQAALFKSSPKDMIGVASGLFNTSRYLGTILSSLLTGIIMGGTFSFAGFQLLSAMLTFIALALVILGVRFRVSEQLEGEV
ncbi:MFS transporter [Paenibacillus nanensis]|uniref:MFS transporter n=1 Tax=Paenibacillus nanensis TaxID=393251 RepID=A0A3A1VH81_9BACL|nr:MFS transporter [Paenibacillus nanensis]RIX59625.1 MFS transporter [Paenibacillus nanensis]